MTIWRVGHIVLLLFSCALVGAGVLMNFETPGYALSLGEMLLAVLTFPLGALPMSVGLLMIYGGWVTPEEAMVFSAPVAALFGHLQWFWWLPALYRRKS